MTLDDAPASISPHITLDNIFTQEGSEKTSISILGSGGGMGSARAQYHLRQTCVFLDLHPLNKPEVFSNAFSGSFDNEGNLIDAKLQNLIVEQLKALQSWTQMLRR